MSATMKDVARSLGVNISTVSRALNRRPGVSADVQERVLAAAAKLNYRIHPLVSALIRSRSNPHRTSYRATIGLWEPTWPLGSGIYREDYRCLIEGVRSTIKELGYALAVFSAQQARDNGPRLAQIMKTRNITGLLLPPIFAAHDVVDLAWFDGPIVAIGYSQRVAVPRIVHDHTHGASLAIEHCRAAGYERIGLVLPQRVSEKVEDRWLAAFLAQRFKEDDGRLLAPLLVEETWLPAELDRWIRQNKPDALLGLQHMRPLSAWTENANRRKKRHAPVLVTLDRRQGRGSSYAGIDHQHELLGQLAVKQLIHLIELNDPALNARPTKMIIQGEWRGSPGF